MCSLGAHRSLCGYLASVIISKVKVDQFQELVTSHQGRQPANTESPLSRYHRSVDALSL